MSLLSNSMAAECVKGTCSHTLGLAHPLLSGHSMHVNILLPAATRPRTCGGSELLVLKLAQHAEIAVSA